MRIQEWSQFPAYGREVLCNELYVHISFKYSIHTHMCILRLVCKNWSNEAKVWHDLNKKQEEIWGWNWVTSGNNTGKPEIDAKHWSSDGKVGWSDGGGFDLNLQDVPVDGTRQQQGQGRSQAEELRWKEGWSWLKKCTPHDTTLKENASAVPALLFTLLHTNISLAKDGLFIL